MKLRSIPVCLWFVASLLIPSALFAQSLSYGGRIWVDDGTPLLGASNMRFYFYNSDTTNAELFIVEQLAVPINQGFFSIQLQLKPSDVSHIQSTSQLYVEMEVDQAASHYHRRFPRQLFTSVPMSLGSRR